ncbi:MAG TPA: response regulator [Alphaproteobacteria bacterium]|nr:response regulator [Alphaproteobacteria bacterium]
MPGISNRKILIVDDDERYLRALGKTLRSEGALVTATQWAVEAIDILSQAGKMDLVIIDLRMPLVNGEMLLRSIRLLSADLPIIVLTAFGSAETRAEALRQGATAFLEKSLASSELLVAIEKIVESQRPVKDSFETTAPREIGKLEGTEGPIP